MSLKILVTGASGLVGSDILTYFHQQGHELIMATSQKNIASLNERLQVIPFELSEVSNNTALVHALETCQAVIHCAAILPSDGTAEDPTFRRRLFDLNVSGTYELMKMAVQSKVVQFIFLSTSFADPSQSEITEKNALVPTDPYKLTKWFGEQMAIAYGHSENTRFATLRISAPYGPAYRNKAVIPKFVEKAFANQDIELWGKGIRRQTFTYVRDISRACEQVIKKEVQGIYNIAGSQTTTMQELAESIIEAAGSTSKVIYSGKPDPGEGVNRQVNIQAAQKDFGYVPAYSLQQGIAEMIKLIRHPAANLYCNSQTTGSLR